MEEENGVFYNIFWRSRRRLKVSTRSWLKHSTEHQKFLYTYSVYTLSTMFWEDVKIFSALSVLYASPFEPYNLNTNRSYKETYKRHCIRMDWTKRILFSKSTQFYTMPASNCQLIASNIYLYKRRVLFQWMQILLVTGFMWYYLNLVRTIPLFLPLLLISKVLYDLLYPANITEQVQIYSRSSKKPFCLYSIIT